MNFYKDIENRLKQQLMEIKLSNDRISYTAFDTCTAFETLAMTITGLINIYGSDNDFLKKFGFLADIANSLYYDGVCIDVMLKNDDEYDLEIDWELDEEDDDYIIISNTDDKIESEEDNYTVLKDCNFMEYVYPESMCNDIIIEDTVINISSNSIGMINNITVGGRCIFEKIIRDYKMDDIYSRYKEITENKIISRKEFEKKLFAELDKMETTLCCL